MKKFGVLDSTWTTPAARTWSRSAGSRELHSAASARPHSVAARSSACGGALVIRPRGGFCCRGGRTAFQSPRGGMVTTSLSSVRLWTSCDDWTRGSNRMLPDYKGLPPTSRGNASTLCGVTSS